ncbi:MAG: EamA family transporter [Ginsengibacter sp.]
MTKEIKKPAVWLVLIAFAATYVLWGTTYIAILIGLETLPPFLMAGIRFIVAGSILLCFSFLKGENIIVSGIYKNLLLGTVILTGGQGLLFWAEQYIPSGYAAIIVSSLPLWYVLLDRKHWQDYFHNKLILAGLVFGFVGIMLLFERYIGDPAGTGLLPALGICAVVAACICWAAGTLYYKNHGNKNSIFLNLCWQLIGGFLSSSMISWLTGELNGFSFGSVSMHSWLATLYLAVIGSLVAFIAFNWLMTVRPPAIVGTYAYVNPVIAVLLGWLIANEKISLMQVGGMVVILVSAFMVNSPKYVEMYKRRLDKQQLKKN